MKQHVTNPADAITNLHVGGACIRPGETRYVEVPAGAAEKAAAEPAADTLAELAKGTIPEIKAALPGLSAEELGQLREHEATGKKRSGALEAIDEAILDRAGDADSGTGGNDELAKLLEGTVDEIQPGLADLSAEELVQLHALETAGEERTTLLEAIDAEIKAKADAQGGES